MKWDHLQIFLSDDDETHLRASLSPNVDKVTEPEEINIDEKEGDFDEKWLKIQRVAIWGWK